MKKFLALAAIFIVSACSAQNNSFQIIALKGDVKLDSLSVSCGQKIDGSHQLLVIGKESYAAVLTSAGYAFQLGKGKHKIKQILDQDISNLSRIKSWRGTGAVNRQYPDAITVLSVDREYSYLAGDSITIIWQKQANKNSYSVTLTDFLERILLDTLVTGNTVTIPIDFAKNKGIIFQVKADKLSSNLMLIKKSPEGPNFRADAACISSGDFIERELLLAGLCEIYNLYYDQTHHLYNLYRYSKVTGKKITHPYYERMLKEHEFEKFMSVQP